MITITSCSQPPHAACQPGRWWQYDVATRSGRNQIRGYAAGSRANAQRRAREVLAHMQELEGGATRSRGWSQRLPGHVSKCGCMTCHNLRLAQGNRKQTNQRRARASARA